MTHKHTTKHLAEALYSVSESNNVLDSVHGALTTLNELVRKNNQFRAFIQSKRITGTDKAKILNIVLGESGQPLVAELVSHLEGRQASHQLQDITDLFDHRYKAGKNIVSVEGTIASEMDDSENVSLRIFKISSNSDIKFFENKFPIKPLEDPEKTVMPELLSNKSLSKQCGSSIVLFSK